MKMHDITELSHGGLKCFNDASRCNIIAIIYFLFLCIIIYQRIGSTTHSKDQIAKQTLFNIQMKWYKSIETMLHICKQCRTIPHSEVYGQVNHLEVMVNFQVEVSPCTLSCQTSMLQFCHKSVYPNAKRRAWLLTQKKSMVISTNEEHGY